MNDILPPNADRHALIKDARGAADAARMHAAALDRLADMIEAGEQRDPSTITTLAMNQRAGFNALRERVRSIWAEAHDFLSRSVSIDV